MKVSKIVVHEEFNSSRAVNDIALLKLGIVQFLIFVQFLPKLPLPSPVNLGNLDLGN